MTTSSDRKELRVTRRLDKPVPEEKPRDALGVAEVGENEAAAQRWGIGAGPTPHWPHPGGKAVGALPAQPLLVLPSGVLWVWSHVVS